MHYTAVELRALNHDRPPARAVRETLFTFRLWLRTYYRRQYTVPCAPVTASLFVNKPSTQPADTLSIGWLNVQSITNKTESVSQVVVDESLDVLALTETWPVMMYEYISRHLLDTPWQKLPILPGVVAVSP